MDKLEIIEIAKETIEKKVPNTYDASKTSDSLRQAFIEANGGSDKFDMKSFRRHPELYDIIEEIVPTMIVEGIGNDPFFNEFVDSRNEKLGDDTDFWAEDRSLFIVSDMAMGTQGIRRQRLDVGTKVNITKTLKGIKIYEELNRLLAGRVNFNTFVDRIGKSYLNHIYTGIFNTFNGITVSTAGFTADYYKTGTFAEETLVTLIGHVEAASNAQAKVIGTKAALRKITTSTVSDSAKETLNAVGHYGMFNGTPLMSTKQAHTVGTDTFIFDDTKLYVVATNDKFIKFVDSGEGYLTDKDPMDNADMTKEYWYAQASGTGIILSSRMGIYDLT